jgi:hypothetical protein
MDVGSVEYIVVAFPGNRFRGEILPALQRLVSGGIIRVLDLALARKDEEGRALAFEVTDLKPDDARVFRSLNSEDLGLLNQDDLMLVAESLAPDSAAAILVWENLWMIQTANAIRDAGGVLVDHAVIPQSVVIEAMNYAKSVTAKSAA